MPDLHPEFNDGLLTRDPALFFNLPGEWTKTDLKRAYTTLIRRWKPEKFPEEFKRLREVYERLATPASAPETATSGPAKPVEPEPSSEAGAGQTKGGVDNDRETPDVFSEPPDSRPASEIVRNESREDARKILERRGLSRIVDALALAYLRAPAGIPWPGVDMATLAFRLSKARQDEDCSVLIGAVERVVATAPKTDFRATLDAFEPFESAGIAYFDITADLWIEFSKAEPDVCLMRLDRLIHFSLAGRQVRHVFFLLRFCIAGAFRLPGAWLREQIRHLGEVRDLENVPTPGTGRLASHGPLGICARFVAHELAYLEALLKVREDLESPELVSHPESKDYRALFETFSDGDARAAVGHWEKISGRGFGTFVPWTKDSGPAHVVMSRVRECLDPAITLAKAPGAPKGGGLTKFLINVAILAYFLSIVVVIIAAVTLSFALLVARNEHEPVAGLATACLTVVGLIAAFVYANKKHGLHFRIMRWLMTPLVFATRAGRVDFAGVQSFIGGLWESCGKHFYADELLLFKIQFFQGTRGDSFVQGLRRKFRERAGR